MPALPDPVLVDETGVPQGRGVSSGLVVFGALALLVLAVGGWWFWNESRSPRSLQAGVEAYRDGRREVARRQFEEAADAQPKLAIPHVYLSRMAREDGDLTRAYREITAAINLEPGNAVAQREMGQYLLQANQPQLARNFLERAIKADPADRAAQGWMGCALSRMGNAEVAERFYQRAGQGAWTACKQAAPGFVPAPGQPLPQPAAAGTVVPGPAPTRR
jgi:tetratricopeptide (TPR) repeat protein